MSLTVLETRTWDELDDQRLAWTALWRQGRRLSYFQSFDWLRTCARHYGEQVAPRIIWVKAGRETLGALPLAASPRSTRLATHCRLSYAHDRLAPRCGAGEVGEFPLTPPFSWPLGPNPTATLWYGCRHLAACDDWDDLELGGVLLEGLDFGRTRTALRQAGLAAKESPASLRWFVDLRSGWHSYWQSRPATLVAALENYARSPAQRRSRIVRMQPDSSDWNEIDHRWLEACFDLATRADALPAAATHRRWFAELHESALRARAVHAMLLLHDDEPVAGMYGFACDNRLEVLFAVQTQSATLGALSSLWCAYARGAMQSGIASIDLGGDATAASRSDLADWSTSHAQLWRYAATRSSSWHVTSERMRRWFGRRA